MKNPKILYIPALRKDNLEELNLDITNLPKEIFLAYSIQYKKLAERIKSFLESNRIKLAGFQQVLGCTKLNLNSQIPILLVGSGRFHALNLALQHKEVYIYNKGLTKISPNDVEIHKMRVHRALNRFLSSAGVGILVSTKPGQNNLESAISLSKKIRTKFPTKNIHIFISNNISTIEFENFQMDCWINTACPGMINDSDEILNLDDLLSMNFF